MIEPAHQRLSIAGQCRLLLISRSTYYYARVPVSEETLAMIRLFRAERISFSDKLPLRPSPRRTLKCRYKVAAHEGGHTGEEVRPMPRLLTISLTLVAAATLTACSASKGDGDRGSAKESAADESVPAALSGEAGFALAADCSAKLKSVSNLYGSLATQNSGADAEELTKRASQRAAAATAFAQIAERAAGTIGKTPQQATQAIGAADAAVQSEFDKRPLEDFATWVTNEVDTKCREALAGES